MSQKSLPLDRAFAEVSASSAGGAPFLIAYGATFLISGVLSSCCQRRRPHSSSCFRAGWRCRSPFGWSAR